MAKRFISVLIIFIFFINSFLFSGNLKNRYLLMIDLCKKIADKKCELKYYSYLYDISSSDEKTYIKTKVIQLIRSLDNKTLKNIRLQDFKKNWVFYAVKNGLNTVKNIQINKKLNFNGTKTISLLLPLSGEFKFLGENILKGVLAGINFFNNPEDIKINIFDTSKQINLKKFLAKHKDTQLIMGPVLNENAVKFKDTIINSGLPAIFLTPELDFGKLSNNIFVHNNNLYDEIKKLCNVIYTDGARNLAILYPLDDLGFKFKKLILTYCNPSIIKAISSYDPEQVDFKAQLYEIGKLKKEKGEKFIHYRKIDSIFIADGVEKALLIIPQLYFYDFNDIKIYGTDLWNTEKIYKLDKKYLKNITFVDCVDYSKNFFLKTYFKTYSLGKLNFYSILAYDTITIIKQINFSSSDTINKDLKEKKFNLVSGITYFDQYGISHKIMKVFRINLGE